MKNWLFVLFILIPAPFHAAIDVYKFQNSSQEAIYKKMIDELRCLVCQNQNLSSSNAALAQDLRQQTYEMVLSGKSHDEIVVYMTQRYGDFVLYRPPFKLITALLWLGPLLLLFVGIGVLIITLNKKKSVPEQLLSEAESSHIKQLLEVGEK